MNYRISKLLATKTYTADATETIDINLSDIISYINIKWQTVAADSTNDNTPFDGVTKIEVVDGSDVLWSLEGCQAEALCWYDRKGVGMSNWNYFLSGGRCERSLNIHFGRYLYDPLYALNPNNYNNLQLKVTMDISEGGCSPATVYLGVNAGVFDEKLVSPVGFFTAKAIKTYTMASTTHEYTDLPTDYPYRNLYFRAELAGTEPGQCISNLKLSEDNDKRIPIDALGHELVSMVSGNYPEVEERFYGSIATSQKSIFIMPTQGVTGCIQSWAAAGAALGAGIYDGDGGRLYIDAATAAGNVVVEARGYVPHGVFEIPFVADKMDTEFYNVQNVGSLRLDVTGAAASQGHIYIQQVRPN